MYKNDILFLFYSFFELQKYEQNRQTVIFNKCKQNLILHGIIFKTWKKSFNWTFIKGVKFLKNYWGAWCMTKS